MKLRKTKIILLASFILVTLYNTIFPRFLITGKYIASIDNEFATFGVAHNDQLMLNDDGTFHSDSWGEGIYVQRGKEIEFNSKDARISTYFNRPLFLGTPRIILFRDLNSEFVKK